MNGSEEREGVIRLLGFLVLASSALSAYCLGLLGFTFATGDLPYGLQPMAKAVQPADTLLNFHRVPRQIEIGQVMGKLQIAPFRAAVSEQQRTPARTEFLGDRMTLGRGR